MPSVRRLNVLNKNSVTTNSQAHLCNNNRQQNSVNGSNNFNNDGVGTISANPNVPRHLSIPYASSDHSLVYETVVLIFSISAFFLQLLHLYRTVWWLPQSYMQYTVKFYLVNPFLVIYILTLIVPRWLWMCCKTVVSFMLPIRWQYIVRYHLQIIVLTTSGLAHLYCIYSVAFRESEKNESLIQGNEDYFKICCLSYLSLTLAITYRGGILRYLELVPEPAQYLVMPVHGQSKFSEIQHKCSSDPVDARQEVFFLRQDFNSRLQNVLFHSYITAFATTILPCYVVQNFIHFDVAVAIKHSLLVWAGSLTLNAVQAFPAKYSDVFHSAAKHLGYWEYVGATSSNATTYADWCENIIWKKGEVVRFQKALYKAKSEINSALPGSIRHKIFYFLFTNPAMFQFCLLVFQLFLIVVQFILLLQSSEWYQMISLSLLLVSSGYPLFKLVRDCVIVWRLSLAEDMLKSV